MAMQISKHEAMHGPLALLRAEVDRLIDQVVSEAQDHILLYCLGFDETSEAEWLELAEPNVRGDDALYGALDEYGALEPGSDCAAALNDLAMARKWLRQREQTICHERRQTAKGAA